MTNRELVAALGLRVICPGAEREIKNVRLIFAGIKDGVDREVIKMRLREQYVREKQYCRAWRRGHRVRF